MSMLQNKQLHLNLPTASKHKLLKFCYFIIIVLLFSCGEDKAEKITQDTNTAEQTEQIEAPVTAINTLNTILCFGDSITAGYGLDDSNTAFPAILQQKIDSLNLNYTVINSGLSGETTAVGRGRINWVIRQNISVFLLELGANDGLRGVPLSETRFNLQSIIDVVKDKSPKTTIILAGMELPPNMGQDYTTEFRSIYADLAEKNSLKFIPFILKDVAGIPELNQSDGIHPTIEGHKIIAKTVWGILEPLINN